MNPLLDIRDRPEAADAWANLAAYLHSLGKPRTAGVLGRGRVAAGEPADRATSGHIGGLYVALTPHETGWHLHVRSHHPLDPQDRGLGTIPLGHGEADPILGEFSRLFPHYAPPDVGRAGVEQPDRRVPASAVARVQWGDQTGDAPRHPDISRPRPL